MKTETATRYSSPLRERQQEETRRAILAAAGEIVARKGLGELSYAAIAKGAGVQERTVYRHFPNREALLDAFWTWVNESAGIAGFPQSEAELLAAPPRAYTGFDAQESVMRTLLTTPQGLDFRLRVNEERKAALRMSLSGALEGLDEDEQTRLLAVVQLLYSATAWATMKDYWGLRGEEAGRASQWAISLILDAVKADKATMPRKHAAGKKG